MAKKNVNTKTPEQLRAALDDLRAWSVKHDLVVFDWNNECFLLDRGEDREFGGAWDGYQLVEHDEGGLVLVSTYDNEIDHGAEIVSREDVDRSGAWVHG